MNKSGIVLLSALVIVGGLSAYVYFHSTSVNEFDDSHIPTDSHKVELFVSHPDAGTIPTYEATVKHGGYFVCTVIPTSHGYVFEGWFSDNTLVSKSKSFSYTVISDVMLEARFYEDGVAAFVITQDNIKTPMNMTLTPTDQNNVMSREWKIKDIERNNFLETRDSGNGDGGITFTVTRGGPFSLHLKTTFTNGVVEDQDMVIVINEEQTRQFAWRYQENTAFSPILDFLSINDGAVTWNVTMPYTEYYEARISDIPRSGTAAYAVVPQFITTDSQVIAIMAENLKNFARNMSDLETVEFVLKFVQSFPYVDDKVSKGVADYWKLPIETLWEQNGDCEDHAILFATLLKSMGFKVVLFHVYVYDSSGKMIGGHVAAGVAVEGGSGYSEMFNGEEYFYCESTSEVGTSILNQANLGYKPDGYEVKTIWSLTQ